MLTTSCRVDQILSDMVDVVPGGVSACCCMLSAVRKCSIASIALVCMWGGGREGERVDLIDTQHSWKVLRCTDVVGVE